MLENAMGLLNGLSGSLGGIVSWAISFITKYAKQLLLIGLVLAAAKMFKVNLKV